MTDFKWLNEKAINTNQGAIRTMFDKASKMDNVISLGIGEPNLNTNLSICRACEEALEKGYTHYAPNAGVLELRKAISKYGLIAADVYDPESEIIVTNGGMGAFALIMQVILEQGDEVLLSDPHYLNFEKTVNYVGGVAVSVPTTGESGFCMTVEEIRKKYKKGKTKAIVINSPTNPTGEVMTREQVAAIAKVAKELDLLVISDEVYGELLYDGAERLSIATFPDMKERTIIINSFSKVYAMTGWRLGYAAGPSWIIDKMTKVQEYFNSCINTPAQYGAIFALNHRELIDEVRETFRKRREIALNAVENIKGIKTNRPKGAFYLFPDISSFGMTSEKFCDRLLTEAGVVCVSGKAFGNSGEGYMRLSYSTETGKLIAALERLDKFCSKL